MQYSGFNEVSLEEILDYITARENTDEMAKIVSTTHMNDFRFSDKYVLKKLYACEFAVYTTFLNPENEAQREFATLLPKVYGLVNNPDTDELFIAMENFCPSSTCSQIELKLGKWCFIPINWEKKQMSKLLYSIQLGSIDDNYRVCMFANKDEHGEITEKGRINLLRKGIKLPVMPNSLSHTLKLPNDDVTKLPLLMKALDYFDERMNLMLKLVTNNLSDIGYFMGSASLIFMIDFPKNSFDVKFIDFGVSFPQSDLRIWGDELPNAVKAIMQDIKNIREDLNNKYMTKINKGTFDGSHSNEASIKTDVN